MTMSTKKTNQTIKAGKALKKPVAKKVVAAAKKPVAKKVVPAVKKQPPVAKKIAKKVAPAVVKKPVAKKVAPAVKKQSPVAKKIARKVAPAVVKKPVAKTVVPVAKKTPLAPPSVQVPQEMMVSLPAVRELISEEVRAAFEICLSAVQQATHLMESRFASALNEMDVLLSRAKPTFDEGRLTTVVSVDGTERTEYKYDADGMVTSRTCRDGTLKFEIVHDSFGTPVSGKMYNGEGQVVKTFEYGPDGQVK